MSDAATPRAVAGDVRSGATASREVAGDVRSGATASREVAGDVRSGPAATRPGDRGQTLPDFAIAIAVFLVAITFVSVFVPQLVVSYDDQERPVVAERLATDLASAELVGNGSGGELNETATRAFFDRNESEALARLGAGQWYSLNVTLRDSPGRDPHSEVLCVDDAGELWIAACGAGDERFAVGPSVPQSDRSVATARRTVFAVDADADRTKYVILEVRVW